jgi:hypothetical protein
MIWRKCFETGLQDLCIDAPMSRFMLLQMPEPLGAQDNRTASRSRTPAQACYNGLPGSVGKKKHNQWKL